MYRVKAFDGDIRGMPGMFITAFKPYNEKHLFVFITEKVPEDLPADLKQLRLIIQRWHEQIDDFTLDDALVLYDNILSCYHTIHLLEQLDGMADGADWWKKT